jgi:hypothetical protein
VRFFLKKERKDRREKRKRKMSVIYVAILLSGSGT